jgi:hypothetical protein
VGARRLWLLTGPYQQRPGDLAELVSALTRPKEYLLAAAEGLGKQSTPAALPACLREIARNLDVLAAEAERFLNTVEEPDDF